MIELSNVKKQIHFDFFFNFGQVPQFILDQCFANNQMCNIVVTQPRRIAAISVARRVCYERSWNIGTVVGYHVSGQSFLNSSFKKTTVKPKRLTDLKFMFQVGRDFKREPGETLLTYVTTGVLLQKLIADKTLKEYTHIIIDEVHERDLESDLLLLVIKKILQDDTKGKLRYVKLILMSATLDATKFSKYFTSHRTQYEINDAPIIKIPHAFRHHIEDIYLDQLVLDVSTMFGIILT